MHNKNQFYHKHTCTKANISESMLFRGVVRGMLPLYLLSLLQEKPYHGNEIMNAIAEMSNGIWKPSPGSVYPLLKKMETDGLITGEWKSGRAAATRIYQVTEKGRKELPNIRQRLLEELRDARDTIDQHIAVLEHMFDLKQE